MRLQIWGYTVYEIGLEAVAVHESVAAVHRNYSVVQMLGVEASSLRAWMDRQPMEFGRRDAQTQFGNPECVPEKAALDAAGVSARTATRSAILLSASVVRSIDVL